MTALRIPTAEVFVPLLAPARYKGAHGGRGSGKSHFFAERLIEDALAFPGEAGVGLRSVGIREVQKTLKESSKRLLEDKLQAFGLTEADGFKVFNEVIQTPKDGLISFQGMQDHNAESIKSLEGYHRAWVAEAQSLSARSLSLLRPTIRWEDKGRGLASELWFDWNPRRKTDAVDAMLRGKELPTGAVVVSANWRDNPWFPEVLEQERLDCLRQQPEQYDHIWEGGYATVLEGAYYATSIALAKAQGRIGRVAADPLMTLRAFCDLGGTGAKADAFAIWIAQFIGKEIRVLDYYEAQGQPLGTHIQWLRDHGYSKASIWLPHDGETNDRIHDASFESGFKAAGFPVEVIKNQGKGAAKARIEAGRRLFPSMWFNKESTEPGLDALGWYHEKKDEARNIGLGPDHDWSSHGADAFGLMCVAYEEPKVKKPRPETPPPRGGWMG
jgi:phage terminase large subunit